MPFYFRTMSTTYQVIFLAITYFIILCESAIQRRYMPYPVDTAFHDTHYYQEPNVPEYKFSYDVTSTDTGDIKSQHESRDGDSVQGYYSLVEPDGTLREVHYTADGYHGFRAIVKRYKHGILI